MRTAWLPMFALAASGCVEGTLAHFNAHLIHVADCTVVSGVEDCRDPGSATGNVNGTLTLDERGEDSRIFLRQDTLIGPMENNSFHMSQLREQVYEQSGCKNRRSVEIHGVVDDPGFGMRREISGDLVELSVTDGDPQACGRNVPYGEIKKYRLTAVEIYNP